MEARRREKVFDLFGHLLMRSLALSWGILANKKELDLKNCRKSEDLEAVTPMGKSFFLFFISLSYIECHPQVPLIMALVSSPRPHFPNQ